MSKRITFKRIPIILWLFIISVAVKAQIAVLTEENTTRASYKVFGHVFGEKDKKPKSDVVIMAYSVVDNGEERAASYQIAEPHHQTSTDINGKFYLELFGDTEYMIHVMKDGFSAKPIFFNKKIVTKGESISIEVVLSKTITYTYKGIIINTDTRQPIEGVDVVLYDLSNGTNRKMKTKAEGSFSFLLENDKEYRLEATKAGYYYVIKPDITVSSVMASPEKTNVLLEKILVGKRVILDYYPFEINDDSITKASEAELVKLYKLMLLNPHINVEIGCYTDARGEKAYNQRLSQLRADATRNYLIRKGINPKRITAKGYGETHIINECTDGVKCSNEKHLENRRIEYIVTAHIE